MGSRASRQVFADIVREVQQAPAAPATPTGGVIDPSGTHWFPREQQISPGQALALASTGALVAWDPCGCSGYCGFEWFGAVEVATLVEAGAPEVRRTKRRRGGISEWSSENGKTLVVAENAVRWGRLIQG